MHIEFVKYNKNFLELSWAWLNDPDTKRLMKIPDFNKKEQLYWFNNIDSRNDYKIWGITYDNLPIGAVGIKNIIDKSARVFWFIGDKNFRGKGLGKIIAKKIIQKGSELGLSEIFVITLVENFVNINLLFSVGFKIQSFEIDTENQPRYIMIKRHD